MVSFDASLDWAILISPAIRAAQKGGEELALAIDALRKHAGLAMAPPILADSSGPSPEGPLILLNAEAGEERRNGFSWRLGRERLEIYGAGGRGLCNGVFSFLAALGMRWPEPGAAAVIQGEQESASGTKPGVYPLESRSAHHPSDLIPMKRLVFTRKKTAKDREQALIWAARNQVDAVVFPFREKSRALAEFPAIVRKGKTRGLLSLALDYDLAVERGGRELSRLLPRVYFLFRPDMFRMERGRRTFRRHFCVTNPKTIAVVQREAARRFRSCPGTAVFHLWPDGDHERAWCSCPSCRAFSPEEQNLIAVNALAETLAHINPQARLTYIERTSVFIGIETWPNTFKLAPDADACITFFHPVQ